MLLVTGCPLACLLDWFERERSCCNCKEFQLVSVFAFSKMMLSNKNISEQITFALSLYVQRSGQKF